MTVAPDHGQIDLLSLTREQSAGASRGTWVALGTALALLLGRLLLWLLVQLLKLVVLLVVVGSILAIGFEVGTHWDSATGAPAPVTTELHHR